MVNVCFTKDNIWTWSFLIKKERLELLEKFQRKSLKQIPNPSRQKSKYSRVGIIGNFTSWSIDTQNSQNLFMNIISDKTSVAERQLAMKDPNENNWFNYIRSILETYNMPSVFTLFHQEVSKSEWKRLLNNSINSHVDASWKAEVESKSSLKYVNPYILKFGQRHPAWSTVRCNIRDNKRTQFKCKSTYAKVHGSVSVDALQRKEADESERPGVQNYWNLFSGKITM